MGRSIAQRLKAEKAGFYNNEEETDGWIESQC